MNVGPLELRAGGARLRLTPALGGRITACSLEAPGTGPQPLFQPYPEHDHHPDQWGKGGLYPLVPYSGRVREGRLNFDGRLWPLTPHPGSPHSLHGIAQRRAWDVLACSLAKAQLRYRHHPDGHWPWAFETTLTVTLEPRRLCLALALHNQAPEPMPGGLGLHPYLLHQTQDHLCFEAGRPWPFDGDYLAGVPPMAAWVSRPQLWGPEVFGAAEHTVFHAGWPGALSIRRGSAQGPERLRLQAQGALDHLVIHRPGGSPYLCVEPVSHVADGFNLHAQGVPGTGTRVLAPGESLQGWLQITV